MPITMRTVVPLVLWTSLIGPVINRQPVRDEGPGVEKRQPLKRELLIKDLPENNLKQAKQKPFKF